MEYDDLPYALIGPKLAQALTGKKIGGKETLDVMKKHSNFQGCFLAKGGNCLDHYCQANPKLKGNNEINKLIMVSFYCLSYLLLSWGSDANRIICALWSQSWDGGG